MLKSKFKYLIEYVDLTEDSHEATKDFVDEKELKHLLECQYVGLLHVNYYMEVK